MNYGIKDMYEKMIKYVMMMTLLVLNYPNNDADKKETAVNKLMSKKTMIRFNEGIHPMLGIISKINTVFTGCFQT